MSKPMKTIYTSLFAPGHKRERWEFTGEYEKISCGHYKASRNKDTVYVPIYKSNDGELMLSMTQLTRKNPQ